MGGDNDFDLIDKSVFQKTENSLSSCGLADFKTLSVVPGIVAGTWFLTVEGETPTISMTVSLRPRIYVRQPEFWGVEVVGCVPPIVLPRTGVFSETIDVSGTMGTRGLNIIGATITEYWYLPDGA